MNPRSILAAVFSLISLALLAYWIGGALPSLAVLGEKKEIRIGAVLELSGPGAPFGQGVVNGAELAFAEINRNGGLLGGRPLKLVVVDNCSEPETGIKGFEKLLEGEGVKAVLGPATTGNALAVAERASARKLSLVTPSATAPAVTWDAKTNQVRDYIFRVCYVDPWQGTAMAKFAYNGLGARKAMVFWEKGTTYSVTLAKAFVEAFEQMGGKVVLSQTYERGQGDFRPLLIQGEQAEPQVIYMPGYYPEAATLVRQVREAGMEIPLLGGDGWDSPRLTELAGAANLRGVYYTNHFSPNDPDPAVQHFVKAYQAKYKTEPSSLAALGYDTALLLAEAIRQGGSDDPEAIRGALAQVTVNGVTGSLRMDASHNPIKGMAILEMVEGKPRLKEKLAPEQIQ